MQPPAVSSGGTATRRIRRPASSAATPNSVGGRHGFAHRARCGDGPRTVRSPGPATRTAELRFDRCARRVGGHPGPGPRHQRTSVPRASRATHGGLGLSCFVSLPREPLALSCRPSHLARASSRPAPHKPTIYTTCARDTTKRASPPRRRGRSRGTMCECSSSLGAPV